MLGYDFPILGLFWSIMFVFLWVIWLLLLFRVIMDVFRSADLGGFAKAAWLLLVIVLPYLGVFVYVIARGRGMEQRDIERSRMVEESFRSYVQSAGGGGGTATELATLADLRDRGVLSDAEFEQQKAKLLA